MVILGLNAGFDYLGRKVDNGASALVAEDGVLAAVAEERLTRKKHAGGFAASMARVLELAGVQCGDVDQIAVSFYQHPSDPGARSLARAIDLMHWPKGARPPLYVVPSHHLSHAASAFFQSPFQRALVCVWDNEGGVIGAWEPSHARCSERHSYYLGEGETLTLLDRELEGPDDVGFGQTFARFTRFAGLGGYTSSGKLMGLAAYGDANRYAALGPLWIPGQSGRLTSTLRARDANISIPLLFARQGLLPPMFGDRRGYERADIRDLAAFVQHQLEEVAISRVTRLVARTGVSAICIAGGVGLNSVLNAKIQEAVDLPVYVPPQPDDTGQAIGNALLACLHLNKPGSRTPKRWHGTNFLGGEFDMAEVRLRLQSRIQESRATAFVPPEFVADAAARLAAGRILGWFQGRSEYGARALGQRSILADPRQIAMRERINRLKGREPYRPVAPAVTSEAAGAFFELRDSPLWSTMSGTAGVKSSAAPVIPAAVHIDGTARLQIVERSTQPLFHKLIAAFGKITGVPVLLNTSFNAAGEPIVESPEDAFDAAMIMGLDALYLSDLRVEWLQ